jgi:hypothetical protein
MSSWWLSMILLCKFFALRAVLHQNLTDYSTNAWAKQLDPAGESGVSLFQPIQPGPRVTSLVPTVLC